MNHTITWLFSFLVISNFTLLWGQDCQKFLTGLDTGYNVKLDAINNLLEEGEYDCVIVLSDKIISEVSQQNDSVNNLIYFNAVSLKSSALFHLDEKEKAIELNELALQQLEDKEVEANVYPKLLQDKGYFLSNSGQFKQAIKVNKEAVSKMLTETREDSLIIRNILNNIGVSFRKIGFLDSSIFYYD